MPMFNVREWQEGLEVTLCTPFPQLSCRFFPEGQPESFSVITLSYN